MPIEKFHAIDRLTYEAREFRLATGDTVAAPFQP
jgi:hypothetical protein